MCGDDAADKPIKYLVEDRESTPRTPDDAGDICEEQTEVFASDDDERKPPAREERVSHSAVADDVTDADYAAAKEGRSGVDKTDDDIDKEEHAKLTNIIKNKAQIYDAEEEKAARAGYELFEKCKEKCKDKKNFEELKSPDD